MASWTDIIPKFNPYIQQLPVDAMVKVGMEKQKRYDEGLQKIQTQIEQVAGLDVIRDVDKKYLQSKLNELGNNLRSVAAGDFSNFQLVNSVGGMVGQIVKDDNVIGAVSSTKAYRKGLAEMEAANKEGKGSPSNDWEFKDRASKWLTSNDLKAGFSGGYNPYTNYKKNALEVVKALTKDSTIKDDAFTVDSKGNLVLADAVVRKKLEGIAPEKIQEALMAALTPADFKQMEIDGRYQYANIPNDTFAKSVETSYKNRMDAFNEQKTTFENAKMATTSPSEKAQLDEKIGQIDKILQKIDQEYKGISGAIQEGNIEAAKARLGTVNFLNGFSKAFSYTETSQTYEKSHLAEEAREREKMNIDWKKFSLKYEQDERHFNANLSEKRRENAAKEEENRIKKAQAGGYGGFPSPTNKSDVPDVTIGRVISETKSLEEDINKSDNDLLKYYKKDNKWLEEQRVAWLKSPNAVDPVLAKHFNQTASTRQIVNDNKEMISLITAEADRKFGTAYDFVPKNAPNLTLTTSTGKKEVYTPRDFVDFGVKLKNFIVEKPVPTQGGGGVYIDVQYDDTKAKAELSPKEYRLYEIEKQRALGKGTQLNVANKVLLDNINNYKKLVNTYDTQVVKEKNKFITNEVSRRVTGMQGVGYTIPADNETQRNDLARVYMDVVGMAKTQKGGVANSPNFDASTLEKIAQSGTPMGKIRVVEGTEYAPAMYEVTAYNKEGSTTFRITPEQKRAVFGDMFEASPQMQAFRPYENMMRKFSVEGSPFLSTNPKGGETNFFNGKLNSKDFTGISSYGVTANIESPDNGISYTLRLNFYDPIKKEYHHNVVYPRLLSPDEVVPLMKGMTDSWVYETLNGGKIATKKDLELLKQASQKPL